MRQVTAGFTLLEAMVALALLGLTVVAMLQLLSGAADAAARVRAHTDALALAQGEMDRLLASGPRDILEADGTEGVFRPPFEPYRYAVTSASLGDRGLIEIRLRVTWSGSDAGAVDLITRRPLAATGLEP